MKVLLINGSPHEKGCTYTALHEVEKSLNAEGVETEIFHIGTKPIRGCMGCADCGKRKNGKCNFTDDCVNDAIGRMSACDGLIVGSPVHYANASGAITSFMDRLFYATAKDVFAYKPAAAVVSCRRAGSTATLDQLNKYFSISNMPVVSSRYWNMVHGQTPEDVLRDEEGLQIMRILGKNMAWLLKCMEAGKNSGINPPAAEKNVFTNFIR